jgi:hypothetical protein
LRIGQALDVENVSFQDAKVRAREGRILASGVLGQTDGMRAVRLNHRTKLKDITLWRKAQKMSMMCWTCLICPALRKTRHLLANLKLAKKTAFDLAFRYI